MTIDTVYLIANEATCADELTKKVIFNDEISSFKLDNSIRIIHFNDVYNIESGPIEPKAGAARFLTAINYIKEKYPNTLVFFSGDAFSPSSISLITKGEQMVPVLNSLNINAACIGNHDFDFGEECLVELIKKTNFSWLISNFFDIKTNEPMAKAESKKIIELNGLKIGIIALVEYEWIETLNMLDADDVIYESFIDVGRQLGKELKKEDKCDYVIALTHMRVPNDKLLLEQVEEIDLVLGGHDHHYYTEQVNGKWFMKSGTDFKDFSLVELAYHIDIDKLMVKSIERYIVDSRIKEDQGLKEVVNDYISLSERGLDVVLGNINSDLDGRFVTVRSMESNIGSYICDLIMLAVNADCVIINSGTLRSDCITPAGEFTVGDLKKIIPFPDQIILLLCDGKTLHEALENSVSQYPKLEGRFPQVAGIQFKFDPSKPPGERIDPKNIKVQNEPLEYESNYKLACKGYMKDGRDGFNMLPKCPVLIDEEDGPLLFTIIENHFKRYQRKQTVSQQHSDINFNSIMFSNNGYDDEAPRTSIQNNISQRFNDDIHDITSKLAKLNAIEMRRQSLQKSQSDSVFVVDSNRTNKYLKKMFELERNLLNFEPKCDGRILI